MARTQSNLSSSNQEMQASLRRGESRIEAAYALVGAILLFGGAGYAVDRWLGSSHWALLGGLAAGIGLGFINLIASLRRA
jgi:F0F1-type ATP synthase assembly protein I